MPIEVRRFGVGHRRPDGPPGTTGIEGQVIESGARGVIAELAFSRRARIAPHSNPNWTCFIVIEGGGWVGVGDERTRVLAGEAVVWPPDELHGAWTDGSPMRAIVVELPLPPTMLGPGSVGGKAVEAGTEVEPEGEGASEGVVVEPVRDAGWPTDRARVVGRGEGGLASRPADQRGRAEGEPL